MGRNLFPGKIDDLHRYGLDLLDEVLESPQPEEVAKGQWSVAFGEAPREWWRKAGDFDQKIRDLFVAQYPALLSDYAGGANDHIQKEREKREAHEAAIQADPTLDQRSDAEKMLDFAKTTQSGPAQRVEASLHGLSATRHREA